MRIHHIFANSWMLLEKDIIRILEHGAILLDPARRSIYLHCPWFSLEIISSSRPLFYIPLSHPWKFDSDRSCYTQQQFVLVLIRISRFLEYSKYYIPKIPPHISVTFFFPLSLIFSSLLTFSSLLYCTLPVYLLPIHRTPIRTSDPPVRPTFRFFRIILSESLPNLFASKLPPPNSQFSNLEPIIHNPITLPDTSIPNPFLIVSIFPSALFRLFYSTLDFTPD